MVDLITVKLEEICTQVTDGTHDSPKLISHGYPLIKGKDINKGYIDFENCDYISEEDHLKVISRSKPEYGDILFANIGNSIGDMAFVSTTKEFSIKNVALIKADITKVDNLYLYYYMLNKDFQNEIKSTKQGAAQPFISLNLLRNFELKINKKLKIQTKIAKVLSNYDDLIENNNKRIKILEEMAQKIYKEWFVDFKFPNHETATFKQTELGEIPTDWEVSNIEKYYNTSSGGTPSRKQLSYYDNGNINWIKTGELKNTFVIDTEEKITEEAIKNSSAKVFPVNTVTLAMYCGMGDISIMSKPMATNQACCVFLPKYDYLEYPFTYLFFSNITKEMTNISFGAAQQNLSQEVIKAYIVKFPSKEIVLNFNKIIKPIFENIRNLLYKNQTLKQTRNQLLPRLISGEIDVENMEIK